MNVLIVNLNTSKRDGRVTAALMRGFKAHGDETQVLTSDKPDDYNEEILEWTQLICFIGYSANQPIWNKFNRAGKNILLVDEAYLCSSRYWRLALNGWQSPWMTDSYYEASRLSRILYEANMSLADFNTADRRAVVYAGVSPAFARWHRLGDAIAYDSVAARRVAGHVPEDFQRLQIQVPYEQTQGLWLGSRVELASPRIPMEDSIRQSVSLVSYAQPACVTALVMGVPVVDLSPPGVNPVFPFVECNIDRIASPAIPTTQQRLIALSRIAWHQFTYDEIASGFALEGLLPYTAKRFETLDGLSETEHVIEQYRYMHANPKMFRGGLAAAFVNRIKMLVEQYKPESLLDYGSGKGRQYEGAEQHKQWGGLKPTCYDPGYTPYATKPTGYFDGVICTDVAEHIPPGNIDKFLLDVLGYARRFVFLCIFTDPAVKYLPDGRNVHLTIKPPGWWNDRIVKTMVTINPQSHPSIVREDTDTFVIRNNGMEVVVFYRDKYTEKESDK